jgi:Ca2+-binding EF-hand superfamily protein
MRKLVTLPIAAAALLGASGIAYAQADSAPAREPLTRAQAEQRSAEAFGRLDANKDGVLSQADRDATRETRQQQRLARLDANDDGQLNDADREARRKEAFDRVDADHSGGISYEEFAALRDQRTERRGDRRGPDGARFERRRPGGPDGLRGPGGPERRGGMVRGADADNDGSITQAEFATAALARFDRVDANKDGTISADERPAPRRMRTMRRPRDAG